MRRWWRDLPYEEVKPIDPNSALFNFDYAKLEHAIAKQLKESQVLTIEMDEDAGYFMLVDDGIGLAKSKSRNVLVRIRDALNAVRETSLVGLTVENRTDNVPSRVEGFPRGAVLALAGDRLVVRLADNKLALWPVAICCVIEPEPPKRNTPWNDPAISVSVAAELLTRWLRLNASPRDTPVGEIMALAKTTTTFLEAREAAEPR